MLKQIFFPSIVLLLIASACNQPVNTDKVESSPKSDNFLTDVKTLANENQLKEKLEELKFGPKEVVRFCNEIGDNSTKAKFIKYITTAAKNQLEEAKKGFWGAIRYNMDSFVGVISILKEKQHKTFMDIGSGNGEKLYASLCLGFEEAKGLEYSADSKALSEAFLKDFIADKKVEITQGDALEITDKYFSLADFAYMYSPMKDNEAMATLFKRVMDSLREGCVFLEVRNVYYRELKAKTGYRIPQHKGWFAVKKQDNKYYYKTSLEYDDWQILEKI
jgi:hypothetical protein